MGKVSPTTLRVLALLAVFALTVAFFATQIDGYLNARLFNRTSTSVAIIALIAVGQAFVILTRNIDLSVGSTVGCVAYLVGGSVRDLLLGRRPKDFDIGTSAHPYQVKKLFRNCWIIGRRFRLAHVKFGTKVIEVATFRRQVQPGEEIVQDGVPAPDHRHPDAGDEGHGRSEPGRRDRLVGPLPPVELEEGSAADRLTRAREAGRADHQVHVHAPHDDDLSGPGHRAILRGLRPDGRASEQPPRS